VRKKIIYLGHLLQKSSTLCAAVCVTGCQSTPGSLSVGCEKFS